MEGSSPTYTCETVNPYTSNADFYTGLIVDGQLDEKILKEKAAELVQAWPALGGQIYREKRPWSMSTGDTVDFESRQLDLSLQEVLHNDRLPGPDAQPTVMDSMDVGSFDDTFIFSAPKIPTSTFRLRVTVLRDATLLAFGLIHHVADGTAAQKLIECYCDLLAGRAIPAGVLPPDSRGERLSDRVVKKDQGDEYGATVGYDEHGQNFVYGFWSVLTVIVTLLWTKLSRRFGWEEPIVEKFIYMPAEWVSMTRKQAIATLSPTSALQEPSKNNIIYAWFLKSLYAPQRPSKAVVDFYCVLNYRGVLQEPSENEYWVHNSIGALRIPFRIAEIQTEPLGIIAQRLRQGTLRYTRASSMQNMLRYLEDNSAKRVVPKLSSHGAMPFMFATSWTGFNFSGFDFSPALCNKDSTGHVVFVNPMVRNMRNDLWPSAITMKTLDGAGYWVKGWNTESGWKKLNNALNKSA